MIDQASDATVMRFTGEILDVAQRLDPVGPSTLAERAGALWRGSAYALLAEAREMLRSAALADPANAHGLAALGVATCALRLAADAERCDPWEAAEMAIDTVVRPTMRRHVAEP